MTTTTHSFQTPIPDASPRRFIQPLAVALVFLLFALLFFGMAMMDLKRLEILLLDAIKKKAVYVTEVTEKCAQSKFSRLARNGDSYHPLYTGMALDDEALVMQESLAGALIDAARNIDQQGTKPGAPTAEKLSSAQFQVILIKDERDLASIEKASLPPDMLVHLKALLEGREQVVIHLFHGAEKENAVSLVGIRRQDGEGVVALVLDGEGLEYWGWKIALQSTLDDLRGGTGVIYIAVEDSQGKLLAGEGSIPREKVEECLLMAATDRDPTATVGQCLKVGDTKFLELAFPFHLDGKTIGTARVGLETHETDRLLMENRRHILLWTGLMVLIGLLAMGLLYQTQNRHVARLQAMREKLHQAARLSSLGKLGAGVAHEIRNPLNAIGMAVQTLQREFSPAAASKKEEFAYVTTIIRDEIHRLNTIIKDFLSLSRSDRLDLRRQSLSDLLERIAFLAEGEARDKGIRVEKRWSKKMPWVLMDAHKMEQALLNIVRNAIESIPGEGCVMISGEQPKKDLATITIRDNGSGISKGEEGKIFDPFYTTKESGVGLGLAIAHEIIAAHNGRIRVTSRPDAGTTFEIQLPGDRGISHRE